MPGDGNVGTHSLLRKQWEGPAEAEPFVTSAQSPPSQASSVMGVVEREVLRPVAWLGQVQDGPQKRRIIRPPGQRGDLYLRTVGQFRVGRQHHHAILDCAFEAHANCLTQAARECKPSPGRSGAAGWECGVGRFATLAQAPSPLVSGRGNHSVFFILPAAFNERSKVWVSAARARVGAMVRVYSSRNA